MFSFSKYSGLGNDFIFIDDRSLAFPIDQEIIQNMCHRKLGIGSDGLVLVQKSQKADILMRIFNSDGNEAEMCGNALRCLYLFLEEIGFSSTSYLIETYERLLRISKEGDKVLCEMGEPKILKIDQKLSLGNQTFVGHFVNTGVPHFVIFVDDLKKVDVENLGRVLSFNPYFGLARSNINFVRICNDCLEIRTYERGVEEETLACGTGAAAAAVVAHLTHKIPSPIEVQTKLGSTLKFNFDMLGGNIQNINMIGDASYVFKGFFSLKKVLK